MNNCENNNKCETCKFIDVEEKNEPCRGCINNAGKNNNYVYYGDDEALINDDVNHPKHYTNHPSGIECKDVTKWFDNCRGQAIQYIWRCEDKGERIKDLEKAIFWLREKIEMYKEEDRRAKP